MKYAILEGKIRQIRTPFSLKRLKHEMDKPNLDNKSATISADGSEFKLFILQWNHSISCTLF